MLRHRANDKPLEIETELDLSIQNADGLDAAHSKGIRPWKNQVCAFLNGVTLLCFPPPKPHAWRGWKKPSNSRGYRGGSHGNCNRSICFA
jgi:hypothetical protein